MAWRRWEKLATQGPGDVADLSEPPSYVGPLDAEAAGQLAPQDCLVDVPGGELVAVERGGVDSAPVAIGTLEQVGDDDVGVQLGVVGATGEVLEGGSDEAFGAGAYGVPALALVTADALGDEQLEVVQGFSDRGEVRRADLLGDLRGGESVDDADAATWTTLNDPAAEKADGCNLPRDGPVMLKV